MNIFEGSRRILKLLSAAIGVGFVISFFYVDPTVYVRYVTKNPISSPTRTEERCPSDGVLKSKSIQTKNDTRATLLICFPSEIFKDVATGKDIRLIPFKFDEKNNVTYGKSENSREVSDYVERIKDSFQPSAEDEAWIDKEYWWAVVRSIRINAMITIILLAVLWGFAFAMGWIVRGFMGIPRGMDSKPKE